MKRHNINRIMRDMKETLGLEGVIGSSTMRKTFSREKIKQLFPDDNLNETVNYLGISYKEQPELYNSGYLINKF